MQRHRLAPAALLVAVAAAIFGCAEQQPEINRVEAYALPKTMFQGEWYYHKTVIDTPSTQSVAFIGQTSWGSQFRIRWDIQEDYLYARTAYEFISGGKEGVSPDTGEYKGEIVGAWKIQKHFDIKKGYNPMTGETNNVTEENSADCVWYDCKYIRVDWSTNHATDVNFMHWGFSGSIKKEPMPFFVQDQTDSKYKPIFDMDSGYIDITTAVALHPQTIYFAYYDLEIPVCWLHSGQNRSCLTEVVKVRHSLWRKNPNRDYEPRLHRGEKDEWFGYFVSERWNYTTKQGMLFRTKKHYMNRHNIWAANHYADKPCKTDKDCSESGSRCDTELKFHKLDVVKDSDFDGLPDSFESATEGLNPNSADSDGDGLVDSKDNAAGDGQRNLEAFYAWDDTKNMEYRCTIPLNKRTPKPVAYHLTGDWPKSLVCDEYADDPTKDNETKPCKPYVFSNDKLKQRNEWSAIHYATVNYEDAWWKVYLRGAYGWSEADYQKWVTSRDPGKFSGQQLKTLQMFGSKKDGFYSFAICPNNPVQESDPWPCRFPRHSYAQAKELMDQGLKFNTWSYKRAKAALDADETVPGTPPAPRIGDMRYSNVHWVKEYNPQGPLGYGPNVSDVRTGEIISGFANIYAATDYVATRLDTLIAVLNGEINNEDYVDGVDIRNWLDKVRAEMTATGDARSSSTTGLGSRVVSGAELNQIYSAMEQPWMKKVPAQGKPAQFAKMQDSSGNPLNSIQIRRKLLQTMSKSGLFDKTKVNIDLSAIKGSQLERRLLDDEVLWAVGYKPGEVNTITDEVLNRASIARGGLVGLIEAREEFRNAMRRQGVDFADEAIAAVDEGLSGLQARLKQLKPKNRWAKIRGIMTRPLVIHEMGHSLGLMHNFGGSEDALNYHDNYWKLRTNNHADTQKCNKNSPATGQLCPFYLRPMNDYQLGRDAKNQQEGTLSLLEYGYTSIMDYDRYSTMMALGLGKYDVASFLYGYTDKVEVFEDTGNVPTQPENIFDHWHEGKGDVLIMDKSAPKSFHYTQWYTLMGKKMMDPNNRKLVDYRKVEKVRGADGRSQGWFYKDGSKRKPRVPYIYCSHSHSNISGRCMTWDWGADYYERMKMHIDNWDTWYIQNAFPRGRFYWSKWSYVSRRYRYFYKRLKDFNNTFALYQGMFHQWYDQPAIDKFFTDPNEGWGDYTMAMHDGFNTAMQTLAMPDIKPFDEAKEQADGQTIHAEATFGTKFSTDISNGRYFATSYYNTSFEQPRCGQYWWECLHHIGFYMDKVMALMALSNPRTYFVGQDTAEDIRTFRISFFDNFSTQIIKFFSAMLGERHDEISPWRDPDKVDPKKPVIKDSNGVVWVNGIARRNYANPAKDPQKPPKGAPVEASTRFTLQLYGAVIGMFLLQNNFDNSYVERARLWKKGTASTWEIKPTDAIEGTLDYTSPFTGVTYEAIKYKDGHGIAQRVVNRCNALKARSQYCSKTPTDPDACVTGIGQDAAEFELKRYEDLLSVLVQVTNMYDWQVGNWSRSPFYP